MNNLKTLEIIKSNDVKHTCYWTISDMPSEKCFEGTSEKGLKPLQKAKKWATENGYDFLEVISTKLGKSNTIYSLNKEQKPTQNN